MEKSGEKLKSLEETLGAPVKLSDKEKEKFKEVFDGLKSWLDDTHDVITKKNQDEAYRYIRLLLSALAKVDIDFEAGGKAGRREPAIVSSSVEGQEEPVEPVEPVVRPTKEQVDGWIGQLTPEMRAKIETLLDCMKQYLDPEGPGVDIICNFCDLEKIARCVKDADPTITDASTIFMNFQQAD